MNKKGFTLVELLAVFVILGAILLLVIPAVTDVLKQSKETITGTQINKILDSAYDYTLKNINKLEEDTLYITLNELKKEGLIDSDIKDIKTKEEYPNNLVISIKKVDAAYDYNEKYSKKNGNYLYTVELNLMNTEEFKNNKPTIIVDGYEESLFKTIDINESFEEPSYSAVSYKNEDLTEEVVKNIIYKSKNIDSIDTSKAGIYYINYTVVDSEGYSALKVLNVVIVDNQLPSLSIPDNFTISSSVDNYDLMKGVSCTDNSGDCEIKINGEIKFGVKDKYQIEYIASDPSGNTVSDKLIITVE